MRHLQRFENMMSQIRCVRFSRKLLDDVSQQVVLRVPVLPCGTWLETQGSITKSLNLFLRCVGRGFTFVEVLPFVLGETRGVGHEGDRASSLSTIEGCPDSTCLLDPRRSIWASASCKIA